MRSAAAPGADPGPRFPAAGSDGRLAGLLLAAGGGRRYGRPKALVEHGGQLLVRHGVDTLRDGGCAPVVVVLGAAAQQVRGIADLSGTLVVDNPRWSDGLGSSLRAGLGRLAACSPEVLAVVVLLVDLPGVTAAAVRRLGIRATADALAQATYADLPGHPVLLGRSHWAGAEATALGDAGARDYLRRHAHQLTMVPCEDIADGADLDRPSGADRWPAGGTAEPTSPDAPRPRPAGRGRRTGSWTN